MALFNNLGNYKNFGLLIIRLCFGAIFIYYGWPKLIGGVKVWEGLGEAMKYVGIHFLPVVWGFLCAIVETLGGALLIIGFYFRPVCLLLVISLVIATLAQYLPHHNIGAAVEAAGDAVLFAGLLFLGPGRYSVDKK
jgi:putative oxidoreductase